MGPEYPGEGAMDNILIAGSTDIQDMQNYAPSLQRPIETKLPWLICSPLPVLKEILKQASYASR